VANSSGRPGGARATDVTDPWEALRTSSGIPGLKLPAGVELSASGGLAVAGLDWLGARVYDPSTRGFLSTDPLAPVLGAGWAGNPYSYAGNDPLHALDPLGLRPATDADLDAYAKANQGALADAGGWWGENWEYVAAGAAIAIGVGLMFTGVGGPVGMVLIGAASGALVSGGASVIQQKRSTGDVDWGKVGVDAAIGGVTGAAAAGAGVFATSAQGARVASAASSGVSRAATAVGGAGQRAINATVSAATSQTGMKVGANAIVGGAGNMGTYAVTTDKFDWGEAGAAFAGGSVSSGLGSGLGGLSQGLGRGTAFWVNSGVGAGSSLLGGATERMLSQQGYTGSDMLWDGVVGAGLGNVPDMVRTPDGASSLGLEFGGAYAAQHLSWSADSLKVVAEGTGLLPRDN
jgi:RHS repeat-associated protein